MKTPPAIVTVIIIVCLLLMAGMAVQRSMSDDAVRSSEIIHPEIELVIVDGQIDTVYVYKVGQK